MKWCDVDQADAISRPAMILSVFAMALLLSGCAASGSPSRAAAPPSPSLEASPEVVDSAEPVIEETVPSEEPTTEAPEAPTTAKIGQASPVGDWIITVTKVTYPADRAIARANSFNDRPDGHYVLVDFTAKYVGSDRKGDLTFGLSWSWTTAKAVSISETDKSIVTPADAQDWPTEVRYGGTLRGETAFDINPAVYHGSTLEVESGFGQEYVDYAIA